MASQFPISGLRSVELIVPDIAAAVAFYTRSWGLHAVEVGAGVAYLRASGTDPYVVKLSGGPSAGIVSVTFRAAEDADLHQLRERMTKAGGSPIGEIEAIADHGGGTGFSVRDAAGRCYRVVQGDMPSEPVDAEGDRPDRLAHVNINTTDLERDIRFFEDGLGFKLTDRSKMMGFVRTNSDHHAIVLAIAPVDTLNHIAFNHDDWESVMKAAGRMCDGGFPIGWGPGRHGPGDNVFTYFVDPFGIVIEHTAEVLVVDDDYRVGGPEDWVWPPGRTDQWGIAPPKTEECKKAQLAIPFL
ncbi:VOC family protein [Rhizobium sp. L1K21]|uniref:VOC family protein n=1 Tax=Rhizobium sp. L1K21 TaxID=2954933 RepID=UPI002092C2E0|nr:VOC family protein [Rhizobium sp. L1K21]MCO6188436.1 VOC family protein [Rhizobium sp. L1K21]